MLGTRMFPAHFSMFEAMLRIIIKGVQRAKMAK